MRALGLDIGTTSICAVIVDVITGEIIDTITKPNDTFINNVQVWERLQSVNLIYDKTKGLVEELSQKYSPLSCIGITGQMHGILYIDSECNVLSPLYTWQDSRGDIVFKNEKSYVEILNEITGYKLATGFGAVTHFYNMYNGLVPASARYICTISDYIAIKLAQGTIPIMNPTNAASIGLFDIDKSEFDSNALESAGMDEALFPKASQISNLGTTKSNIPVAVAIGDNQASFLGSVKDINSSILVNVGTGSQISVFTQCRIQCPGVETRPFAGNGYLLAGASLCGGSAYSLLENFFRSTVRMATGKEVSDIYGLMAANAEVLLGTENKLEISTKFKGTRDNPTIRGSINNIGTDNFTPGHLVLGVLDGIAAELNDMYKSMIANIGEKPTFLIGSGNGIRKNMILQKILSKKFKMQLQVPVYKEEAAYGAALFALVSIGYFKSFSDAQAMIRYECEI